MDAPAYHIPVLATASLEGLGIGNDAGGTFVDATFGGGGHTQLMLDALSQDGHVYGMDQDADARDNLPDDGRFTLIPENFRYMRNFLRQEGVRHVNGILGDLGVSSHQFDTGSRGFSTRFEGPLDMRMNQSQPVSAADVIATYTATDLTRVFRQYGELKRPDKAAYAIESARKVAPIERTSQLKDCLRSLAPRGKENQYFAQVFQALRIEVNDELGALQAMLLSSIELLEEGGRLAIISYHSLEDRMVKHFMRSGNFEDNIHRDFKGQALCPFNLLSRKAIVASGEEQERNPRARSARLRVAQRTGLTNEQIKSATA
jgi:16S rRNA (cytosine1402-N4)-methyltransferase